MNMNMNMSKKEADLEREYDEKQRGREDMLAAKEILRMTYEGRAIVRRMRIYRSKRDPERYILSLALEPHPTDWRGTGRAGAPTTYLFCHFGPFGHQNMCLVMFSLRSLAESLNGKPLVVVIKVVRREEGDLVYPVVSVKWKETAELNGMEASIEMDYVF